MASYTDLIYAKSRYTEPRYCGSGCIATSPDFSLAMVDMCDSDFRDDYSTLENTIACYLGFEEPDASIYDAKFLNRLAKDFPQYLHVIEATDPYDSNMIKDTYNTIIDLQQPGRATRRVAGNKRSCRGTVKERTHPFSVFHGSYDEQHASRKASKIGQAGDVADECVIAPWSPLASQSMDDIVYGDDSDPDYIQICSRKRNKRLRQNGGQGSRESRFATTINVSLRNSESPLPALSPGGASSPEADSIQTPTLSPVATLLDCDINESEPENPSSGFSSGLSKDSSICSRQEDNLKTTDRLVASWGSDMGRFCHAIQDGFECSCGHRTGTLGDMTRHWQSKRHSEAAFRCKACGKAYTRDDALKRHIRRNDECARKARRIRSSS